MIPADGFRFQRQVGFCGYSLSMTAVLRPSPYDLLEGRDQTGSGHLASRHGSNRIFNAGPSLPLRLGFSTFEYS